MHQVLRLLSVFGRAGCAGIGPGTVTRDRFDSTTTVAESWKSHLLPERTKRFKSHWFNRRVGTVGPVGMACPLPKSAGAPPLTRLQNRTCGRIGRSEEGV